MGAPKSMNLKILSFNWHEPYICLLSEIGHRFLIVEPEITNGNYRRWDKNMRPIPSNVSLISDDEATSQLDKGEFDIAIAHNIKDLVKLNSYNLPKILVFHNKLSTEILLGKNEIIRDDYLKTIDHLLKGVKKVFISESKRLDWGMDGEVILPGIDVDKYGGYTGYNRAVLRVGNLLKERDLMMGFSAGEAIVSDLPSVILGLNPSIKESKLSSGFDDLIFHYRSQRVFLNTTAENYEDGYNLALLEAMAVGMPVISTANKTSPIKDGVNGFISKDMKYLTQCAVRLLDDPNLAKAMGEKAKETVRKKFPKSEFIRLWQQCIQDAIIMFLERTGISLSSELKAFHKKSRKNILMDYVSYPATTGFYLERSFRKKHNVITCGATIDDEMIREWNLENLHWPVKSQDIFRKDFAPLSETIDKLPDKWIPDLYLWVETGLGDVPPDLKCHTMPKACYLIDTHINFKKHIAIGRQFDFIFVAQKLYVEALKESGCKNVIWVPLACDPEIHGEKVTKKKYEVGFVGTIGHENSRRKHLLDTIAESFELKYERRFMDEMADLFSASKIVFNNAINNDLNMRVFEALCSGSLLLTDRAKGSGLEWLFKDGKHLAIYDDERLTESIRFYLDRPDLMKAIATAGRKEVLANHTYDHRATVMIESIDKFFSDNDRSEEDQLPQYYRNIRYDLLSLVPDKASFVLEVGCAAGMTGNELKKKPGVFVAGIELNPKAAAEASKVLDDVVEGNIEFIDLPYEENSFDCILFADILEHLVDPLAVLKKTRKLLKCDGTVVASLPNVQYLGLIHHLIEGNWTYQDEGILDRTHLRFFTYREIEKLFDDAGYEICQVDETIDPQYEKAKCSSSMLNIGRLSVRDLSPEEFKRFFVFQYKISAKLKEFKLTEQSYQNNKEDCMNETLGKGKALENEGHYEEAVKAYKKVDYTHPDYSEVLARMGNCYMRMQDLSNAENHYRQSLKLLPECYTAGIGLGLLQLQLNKLDDAIGRFFDITKLHPDSDKAWSGLGIAYRKTERMLEAMDALSRALKINVENKAAMSNLLELSYQQNRFSQIEFAMKQYLEIYPSNVNILFGLAGIQYKSKRTDDAQKTLSEILLLDPEHDDAIKMLDKISSHAERIY